MSVEECSPLYPPPCALVANHQMDSTSLNSVRLVNMNGFPLPGTGTAYVCTPASETFVITSRIPCLAHRGRGRVFPAVLASFGYKPLAPDVVVQQVDLQQRAGRCEYDRSAADEKVGGWELLCGVFRKHHVCVSGVLWNEVGVVVVDVRLRELVKIYMRRMTGNLFSWATPSESTRPHNPAGHVSPCGSLSWAGGPS